MAITGELRYIIEQRGTFNLAEAQQLMTRLLAGDATEMEVAALLGAMAARGETGEEIAGFALAMRTAATTLPLAEEERRQLVDTCGTGGDGSGTFNISTGAALVAAAAGARVAKHGNRAVTSRCGSADVLEALGIPINLAPEAASAALREHGFCFLLAQNHHPAMRSLMPVRRGLGVRTILNLLGPLLNPAGARRQVMGVYSAAVLQPIAEAMTLLGVQRAMVVHGSGGLDELSVSGTSTAVLVPAAMSQPESIEVIEITPESAGLSRSPLQALAGGETAQENADLLLRIFAGEPGPRRDAVVLNAAAVLEVAELAPDMVTAAALAIQTIDSGAVQALVARLAVRSTASKEAFA